ncbi:MAG: 50S ribosomal protein L11 methyltransferase [Allomuricauda sp.]|nr:MAG: 50S ribosomal protein L11 methyltransferase [Allomuricauda sp.]
MTYLEFHFKITPLQPGSDILIAELAEIGFESFVENPNGLQAYVKQEDFSPDHFEEMAVLRNDLFDISYTKKTIAQQNWNAKWEADFDPIVVDGGCRVRASFHSKGEETYDIIIDPKMSFGTGHHETTFMMLQHMLVHDFDQKTVLDMGCGTGVLAILAEKMGASKISAIDIDPWCVENTNENIGLNSCQHIEAKEGGVELIQEQAYDVLLANINRNVLTDQIPAYVKSLKANGILFVSGFYSEDLDAITAACEANGMQFEKNIQKNKWVSAKYVF